MSVVEAMLAVLSGHEDQGALYECHHCGSQFSLHHHSCPECGGYSIDRVEWSAVTE
jgi:primosomal protein N'